MGTVKLLVALLAMSILLSSCSERSDLGSVSNIAKDARTSSAAADSASQDHTKSLVGFDFSDAAASVPIDFRGDDLSHIMSLVQSRTRHKEDGETTKEYEDRMAVIAFDPAPLSHDRLYSLRFSPAPFDAQASVQYNADRAAFSIHLTGVLTNGFCRENEAAKRTEYSKEVPLACYLGAGVRLSLSNKSPAVGKLIIRRKASHARGEFDLVTEFSFPRDRLSELRDEMTREYRIATLMVGKIVKNQSNPKLKTWVPGGSSFYSISGSYIPFELNYIVHYNEKNGSILHISKI